MLVRIVAEVALILRSDPLLYEGGFSAVSEECMRGVAFLVGLTACNDTGVKVYNTPPAVSILTPTDGSVFAAGELIELQGVAEDSQDDPTALLISWESTLDGVINTDPPDTEGTVYAAITALTGGEHAITLTAVDSDGESASTSIGIQVGDGNSGGDDSGGGGGVGSPPVVILAGPADGATYLEGESITFVGTVTDPDQAWDTVSVSLISDRDGKFWEGNPDSGGTVSQAYASLSQGVHSVTLRAEDADGNIASDAATITLDEDGRPTAVITAPADGSVVSTDDTVIFEGRADDNETDTELLTVVWKSSLDGVLSSGAPDSSGYTAAPVGLSEGTHVITLTVVDGDGKEGTDSETITVQDPNNVDDDSDGYTELEGDCDDTDGRVNPDADDDCDEVDDDCDGTVNGDYADAYEPNESTSSPYDLGEVDSSFLWDGATASISGLSLHNPDDVDCFYWSADDEYYDNVSIYVEVGVFASAGKYVATLYLKDGSTWDAKDSASASARLTMSVEGDLFDDDEDEWAVCVEATSWDDSVCDGSMPYTIEISS